MLSDCTGNALHEFKLEHSVQVTEKNPETVRSADFRIFGSETR